MKNNKRNQLISEFEKEKINEYAEKLGLTTEWINDILKVTNKTVQIDTWFIEQGENRLMLKHVNSKFKEHSNHEHCHKIGYDYFYLIRHIAEHDKWMINKKHKNKKDKLFDMINTGNIPYIKLA